MDFTMPPGYIDWLLKRRKAQLLHGEVERRLIQLLARVLPDYHPVQEPQGLAGGRNDLMLFEIPRTEGALRKFSRQRARFRGTCEYWIRPRPT